MRIALGFRATGGKVKGLGFTSPKSLSRVLEFLFYLWWRMFRWVFLGAKCLKHLPAHVLALTPLREISFLMQKSIKKIDQKSR